MTARVNDLLYHCNHLFLKYLFNLLIWSSCANDLFHISECVSVICEMFHYCFQSISQSRRGRPIDVHADSEACKSEMAEEVKKKKNSFGRRTLIAKTNKQLTLIIFFFQVYMCPLWI